jgi:hypothetical protein
MPPFAASSMRVMYSLCTAAMSMVTDDGARAGVRRPRKARATWRLFARGYVDISARAPIARSRYVVANYFKCVAVNMHGVAGGDFTLVVVACCPPACCPPRLAASMASSSTCLE